MSLGRQELSAIAAEWRAARCMYPVYTGIADLFELDAPACQPLESPVDHAEPEALASIRRWIDQMDDRVKVHQLRFFLQTSPLSTEAALRALVQQQLRRKLDRDKLDFLLVQYFAQCAPANSGRAPKVEAVARTLMPVLGDVIVEVPEWNQRLEKALAEAKGCVSMRQLLQSEVLSAVRQIKSSVGQDYFSNSSLIVFTRFNYILRQVFFRLMRADVDAIRQGVHELEKLGVASIDCSRAQLSSEEPLASLADISQRWKEPFRAEYSAGNPFAQLAELRAAVDETLATHRRGHEQVPPLANAATPASTPASGGVAPRFSDEVGKLLLRLPSYLASDPRGRTHGVTIMAGKSRLELPSAEVIAFLDTTGAFAPAIRHAIAGRILLFQAIEHARRGGTRNRLDQATVLGKAETVRVQQAIRRSQELESPEAEVLLTGILNRLAEMLKRAEEIGQPSPDRADYPNCLVLK